MLLDLFHRRKDWLDSHKAKYVLSYQIISCALKQTPRRVWFKQPGGIKINKWPISLL